MKKISFGELRDFIGADEKEARVPSFKRLRERGTQAVAVCRCGSFRNIQVMNRGTVIFQSGRCGVYKEIVYYPVGGVLSGLELCDMHVMMEISNEDGAVYEFYGNKELQIVMDEMCDVTEEHAEIRVYADGNVLYSAGGKRAVFHISACGDYCYGSVKESTRIERNEMDELGWEVRLMMRGEDKLAHNSRNKKKEVYWDGCSELMEIIELVMMDYLHRDYQDDLAWEMLLRLKDEDRALILMYFFYCKRQTEIAREMNLSRETVCRRLKRILGELKEMVK